MGDLGYSILEGCVGAKPFQTIRPVRYFDSTISATLKLHNYALLVIIVQPFSCTISQKETMMDSTNTVTRSIEVKADRERVWRALTQPEAFSKWFGSKMEFGPVVGGTLTFEADTDPAHATITLVEPPQSLAFRWTPEPKQPYESLVTFVLEALPDGTRITVTEEGFDALPPEFSRKRFEMNGEGWTMTLDAIAAYLQEGHDASS